MIHGGVRWKSRSSPTCGWILGTTWIAEAPVPITATRLPRRSCSWSHCAVWNAAPAKLSRPGISGIEGSLRPPIPEIAISAVSSPREVSMRQRRCSSSHLAPVTECPKRMWSITPWRSAVARRYSQISGCSENVRLQSGFGANENEYRCEGTSHWQPGYVFARHVPPTSSPRSSTTKSSIPACLRRIAVPKPEKPAPTMTIR
jgi:hypothetical protein